jgi:retron-type reverse transcriptase
MAYFNFHRRYERLGRSLPFITGLSDTDLSNVSLDYRLRKIPKKDGTKRILRIPNGQLRYVQHTLLNKIFQRLPVHNAAKGFVRGRGTVHHAQEHTAKPWVILVDIENYFSTTSTERVARRFVEFGWSEQRSLLVARVVCHPTVDGLPQGAPTSPIVSNIVNFTMDHRLAEFAQMHSLVYSRYADDLAFSPRPPFDGGSIKVDPRFVIRAIKAILHDYGYKLRSDKTRILRRNQRQVVTGIVVNRGCALSKEVRKRLRAAEHRLRIGKTMSLVSVRGDYTSMTESQLHGWKAYEAVIQRAKKRQRRYLRQMRNDEEQARFERQRNKRLFDEKVGVFRQEVARQALRTKSAKKIAIILTLEIQALKEYCQTRIGLEKFARMDAADLVQRAMPPPPT